MAAPDRSHDAGPVRVHHAGGRLTITLDSPANRNALSRAVLAGLHDALGRAADPAVRVVVLDHTGPAFCAGADLKERRAGGSDGSGLVQAIEQLGALPVPVIAAVHGAVRAGGVGLMAACDLVVVDRSVTFAFTEVRLGVAPAIISVPVLARCTWSSVAAAFLTGEPFDADEAATMGLITHSTDDVAAVVERLCAGVCAGAPGAVSATKRLLREPGSMAAMAALSDRLFAADEAQEGMAAFAERRPPRWQTP